MRILVTGGAGFAGLHLLRELTERGGDELYATLIEDAHAEKAGPALARVRWLKMDLRAEESIRVAVETARPDVVYHLAGQSSVGRSFADPAGTWDVNATGTLRLMTALGRGGGTTRFLLISSAEVYGSVPPDEQPIAESREPRPMTPYGVSKAGAELVALCAGRANGLDVVVARSFNHVGPGQDDRFFLPGMARQLVGVGRGEGRIIRTGNLDITRDFLDVRDVARAYVRLMEAGTAGRVYNVCSGEGRTLESVVGRLIEMAGGGVSLESDPTRVRAIDIPVLVGDGSALETLGWRSRIALDVTLRDLLREAEAEA